MNSPLRVSGTPMVGVILAVVALTLFLGGRVLAETPTPIPAYKLYGLDFGPYMDGQDPNKGSQVGEAQIRARMEIVVPYTEWIRTFGCGMGLEKAGQVAHELGLQAAIGAWLGRDSTANDEEIARLIAVGQAGGADMLIVGSEVLLRGDLTQSQLIGYINQVRQAVPGVPVATADVHSELIAHPLVVAAGDVVLANFYPYWEGIDVQHAIAALHSQYEQVRAVASGKEVIVSETGWPSDANEIDNAIPSPENASFYFLNFVSWARAEGDAYLYFEAFDETWKAQYEGHQGAHWGVWDKDGNLKPGMQDVFDEVTIPDNWSGSTVGAMVEFPETADTETAISEPATVDRARLAGLAVAALAVLSAVAWYVRRRLT